MSKQLRRTGSDNDGFTLIELSLAITFIGTLLVLAAVTIVQSISVYNKGLAVKQMNQVGRSLTEDLRRISTDGSKVTYNDNGVTGYLCIDRPGMNTRAYLWNSRERGKGDNNGTRDPYDASKPPYGLTDDAVGTTSITVARTVDSVDADVAGYCQSPTATRTVDRDDITKIAGLNVRVLSTDIAAQTSNPGYQLSKLTFWLGTFSDALPGSSPQFATASKTWSCEGGSLGTFCAFSKYETVIYTPNQEPSL